MPGAFCCIGRISYGSHHSRFKIGLTDRVSILPPSPSFLGPSRDANDPPEGGEGGVLGSADSDSRRQWYGKGFVSEVHPQSFGSSRRGICESELCGNSGTLLEASYLAMKRRVHRRVFLQSRTRRARGRGTLFLDGSTKSTCPSRQNCFNCFRTDNSAELWPGRQASPSRVICATIVIWSRTSRKTFPAGSFLPHQCGKHTTSLVKARVGDIAAWLRISRCSSSRHKVQVQPLSSAVMSLLEKHPWPGNIRELENLIERYVILGSEDAISSDLLTWESTHAPSDVPLDGQIHLKKVTASGSRAGAQDHPQCA